ncbi:DUF998 domain-containing protein [Flavobacterium sufflavum]|uniref:DUF998 domain-containing protein n=1 Tax=Flavobacterium sufflavum TaxID=1921138 RepID=A0A437KKM1_9FLAO|nr:DUF998 domain-containing protein [Flavobacterium sufflavum]RVT71190.1 DUF998 domain-containing protein [Flavobacterium sufflavum]
MRITQFNLVKVVAMICIISCISDFIVLFLLGNCYPGYSQLKNTISSLGASVSPVSYVISLWWIFIGTVFVFFGIIIGKAFDINHKNVKIASLLIILYGLGEGIGSGLFKADRIEGGLTKPFIIHNILGGIGVIAALILPLIMRKLITKKTMFHFYLFSWVVFIIGIITMLLFAIRFSPNEHNFLVLYKGLWQRLFLLNLYTYFIVISIIMYNKEV